MRKIYCITFSVCHNNLAKLLFNIIIINFSNDKIAISIFQFLNFYDSLLIFLFILHWKESGTLHKIKIVAYITQRNVNSESKIKYNWLSYFSL